MFRNAYLLLILTTLFWGGNAVAGKLAVGHLSPMALTTLRWTLATAIMLTIGMPRLRQDWPVIRRHLPLLTLLGMSGFSVFNAALYSALHHTSAINVSIEQAAMPMLVFAANFLLHRIGVAPGQIVGFTLSLLGVALTATHGDVSRLTELDLNVGDALMLFAIVIYAIFTVALRYKPQVHWQSLMIALCAIAFVTSLPFLLWETLSGGLILPDARGWTIAAYTAIFPSVLGQFFFIRGVELIGANRAVHPHPRRGVPALPRHRDRAGARRHLAGRAQRPQARAADVKRGAFAPLRLNRP
jgi:drug/metabolite transporter (DMT)-like permease